MVAQWVRAMGAGEIALFDIQTEKLELARSLGFQQVFDSRKVDATGAVEKLTGGRGVHVAIEAAGVSATMIAAMKATRRSGRVVLLGNPAGDVTLPAEVISQVMRREIDLKGTWNSDFSVYGDDDDWRTTLAAMASGTLNLKPLITHRVPLRSGIEMLQVMRDQSTFFAKVLVHPNSSQD
jgi:L-iditol 2-dehydrogenase